MNNAGLKQISYSIQQASDATGISTTVIRRKIAAGYIAVKYVDTKPYISAEELVAWFDSLPSESPTK